MNKKGLLGITIAIALTVVSTAVVAFAGEASRDATKNVVKLVGDKKITENKIVAKNADTASEASAVKLVLSGNEQGIASVHDGTSVNDMLKELNEQLQKLENGTIKSTPENIQNLKNLIEGIKSGRMKVVTRYTTQANVGNSQKTSGNNSTSNVKLLNISDDKAIQMAEAAIKDYTGTDVEKVMARDGLKPYITRNNSQYAWGPDILVTFNSNSNTKDNILASISAVDGKVYNVTAMAGGDYSKTDIDENKVKQAAAEFLNNKGFGSNYQNITVDNEKASGGLAGAKALYEDGTEILMEFKISDYSVVSFTHYNMKTMKFAN